MATGGDDRVRLENAERSAVVVHLHGATVISWTCCGTEMLFCSEKAVFDNKKAIRGGIPLVFPQFGPWSLGPQHGFARIKRWHLESQPAKNEDGTVVAKFSLVDDEETRKMWDTRFKLLYTVCLCRDALQLTLDVTNNGASSFDFTTLMHTYFRVPDVVNARISGLEGCMYADKVLGGEHKEERSSVGLNENYDRIYQSCNAPVKLISDVGQPSVGVAVDRTNLPDIVVWNPWVEKARGMADFGDEEYKVMLCVEAGHVSTPVTLAAGASVAFSQKVVVSSNL